MSGASMEAGAGRSLVRVEWRPVGDDIQILVTGGEIPHIGAVALAHLIKGRAEASVFTVPGHMETELALEFARDICGAAYRAVAVTCGIHIDNASPEEIKILCENARKLKTWLTDNLKGEAT